MAATLRVGSLDLSRYLDLQQNAGLDPASSDYVQQHFSSSPLREGGTLAVEQSALKTLTWPLLLSAANKDALTQLVQQINRSLAVPDQTLAWQDEGASQDTIFDLEGGLLQVDFDFRRGQQNWLHARLVCTVQPFGYTSAPRIVATAHATGPIQMVSFPSIAGDAPAQLVAQISGTLDRGGASIPRYVALSVLPASTYKPAFGASEFFPAGFPIAASVWTGASADIAYQNTFVRRITAPTTGLGTGAMTPIAVATVPAAHYPGRNRVLVIARPVYPSGAAASFLFGFPYSLYMSDSMGNTYPTVSYPFGASFMFSLAPTQWRMFDMGAFSFPTGAIPTTPQINVWAPIGSVASHGWDVTSLIVLPESDTVFLSDPGEGATQLAAATYVLDDTVPIVKRNYFATSPPRQRDMSAYMRGNIPRVQPGTVAYVAALHYGLLANDDTALTIAVRERVRFVF